MKTNTLVKTALLTLALTGLGSAMAQDQLRTQDQLQTQDMLQLREQIYAYDYMTQRERDDYMERMRVAKTEQERERIRAQHQEQMEMRVQSMNRTMKGEAGSGGQAGRSGGSGGSGSGPMIIIPKGKGGGRN